MKPKFGRGDKVFAKVRGYPPWPARVEGLADETPNRMRYHIYFYGTGETAVVKAEDICSFVENRAKLGKPKKHKNFTDALVQIEAELSPEEIQASKEQESTAENETEDKQGDELNSSRRASTSSKSGKTPSAKKERKRRVEGEGSGTEETEQKKTKPGVLNVTDGDLNVSKPSPEVMSRSGRKIKPKRFADFDDSLSEEKGTPKVVVSGMKTPRPKGDELGGGDTVEEDPLEESVFVEVEGEKVEIPLRLNRPTFKSSKSAYVWDSMVRNYALTLKRQVERGEAPSEGVEKHMDNWTRDKLSGYEKVQEEREVKLSQLRVETLLLDLDTRIKGSLSLTKAEPEKCLGLLDELLGLDVSALMLKKHPEIVETIKKMRKYVGNTAHWKYSPEETQEFHKQALAVRKKSETVYAKFKNLFLVPNGKSFWETFAKELEAFNKKTENMTMEDVFSLTKEPK